MTPVYNFPVNEHPDIRLEITDGFHLGPIVRDDKAAFLEHFTDPAIAENLLALPFPYTEADADWWIDHCEQCLNSQRATFGIREPSGGLIGGIGVVGSWSAGDHKAEFGYWLAKSYRGRGLVPRAIDTFATHAFGTLGVRRLYATPFAANFASHRALEKADFQREGVLKGHHLKQGACLDAVIYGRLSARGDSA